MISTEWRRIAVADGEMDVFVARSGKDNAPSIVLIQEIFGVNDHIQSVVKGYAEQGYDVYAPDIFWRSARKVSLSYAGDDMQTALGLLKATDEEKVLADILVLRDVIAAEQSNGKCAVMGYCFGGLLTYMAAASGKFDAGVSYYGGRIGDREALADSITVPMMFHFGEKDSHIPMSTIDMLQRKFAGRSDVSIYVHPEADHGFNCSVRASYHEAAAARAAELSKDFLANVLA